MARTVTVTASNGFDAVVLKVFAITGGAEAGGSGILNNTYGTPTFTISPEDTNSLIVEADYCAQNNPPLLTPNTNNSTSDSGVTGIGGNGAYWYGYWNGPVTSLTAIETLGGTNDDEWNCYAAYEVVPSGGSGGATPAIDASTPAAVVGTESSATTASFTPPNGAVLVALVLTNSSASPGFGISDSGGLTWTQRFSTQYEAYDGASAIFTATIPGGGGPPKPTPIMACFP